MLRSSGRFIQILQGLGIALQVIVPMDFREVKDSVKPQLETIGPTMSFHRQSISMAAFFKFGSCLGFPGTAISIYYRWSTMSIISTQLDMGLLRL
jgi:hypothetical protein